MCIFDFSLNIGAIISVVIVNIAKRTNFYYFAFIIKFGIGIVCFCTF